MKIYDAIIIGAGAAGMMASISAGERGKTVLLLEKNEKPGMKILISGGGRCNFTNLNVTPQHYVSQNPHFCVSALKQFTQDDFIEWVKEAKIEFYEKTLGQLFCKKSSREIVDLLLFKMKKAGVELKTGVEIKSINHRGEIPPTPLIKGGAEGGGFMISTQTEAYISKNLIIATGGLSYPKLGASDFGYKIARQFGHTVTDLSPALDAFVFTKENQNWCELSGLSLLASVKVGKYSFTENILFTHFGLSGPAVLKASLYWKPGEKVEVDFLPEISNFEDHFLNLKKEAPKKTVLNTLTTLAPSKFAEMITKISGITEKKMGDLSKVDLKNLSHNLKHFTFIPQKTAGYDKAEVTRGGVSADEISSQTMESRLLKNIFFIGEVVDVTGLLGGYNFQWAWSSGWVAGKNIG